MTIEIEFRRGGTNRSLVLDIQDGLPWRTIRELALHLMRRTHSVNVRVCIGDKWSQWIY